MSARRSASRPTNDAGGQPKRVLLAGHDTPENGVLRTTCLCPRAAGRISIHSLRRRGHCWSVGNILSNRMRCARFRMSLATHRRSAAGEVLARASQSDPRPDQCVRTSVSPASGTSGYGFTPRLKSWK
jgi:hypothetical protein